MTLLFALWIRIVTPRFDVVSSAGDRRTRELVRDLETFAAAIPIQGAQPASTRVYLFARRGEVQPYFDLLMKRENAGVVGTFVAQGGHATMFIDDSRSYMHDRTPYHELVHYLMGTSVSRAPLWVEEGLAEYYSSAEVHGGIIKVGSRIREHVELLKRKTIPVAELFTVTGGTDVAISTLFYAESWAIVDWMIAQDRQAFDAFLRDVTSGVGSEAALQKHFHKSAKDMESLIGAVPDLSITLQTRVPEIDVAATPLPRDVVLYDLGAFLANIDGAKSEAEKHFRAAVEANPKHARALAAIGEFERAIAADPNDGEVLLEYAESLKDTPHARELAEKALASGADRMRAQNVIRAAYNVHARTELERINELLKAEKLDEAAALTRALSAAAPDAAAKQQLDDQAKQLENEVATNREIAAYNDAVQRFNARDYRGAQTIIDELMKTAHSPQVIADAAKMKELLRELLKHR